MILDSAPLDPMKECESIQRFVLWGGMLPVDILAPRIHILVHYLTSFTGLYRVL
jgi:hypothetical protein